MNNVFPLAKVYNVDCYVADYTEQTKSQKGVEISVSKFEDIASFHLKNPNLIEFWGINFEECDSFFKDSETGVKISQCECMFASKNAKKKGWICLVELKYCKEKNIGNNSEKAYDQLFTTLDFLKEKGVLCPKTHRIYLNYSVPDYSNKEPFAAFRYTPEELMNYKKQGIQILGYNNVLIFNEGFIKVPEETFTL